VSVSSQAIGTTTPVQAGLMYRHVRDTFKLALVVELAVGSRVRVSVWRAASGRWTKPVLMNQSELVELTRAEYKKHARTIKQATAAAFSGGLVSRTAWS
jgi:hypothetical protein